MTTQIALSQLGQNILVVLDGSSAFLDALHAIVQHVPQMTQKVFALLCCCPTHYWEHGGDGTVEEKQFIHYMWEEETKEFNRAKQYLEQAQSILQAGGIPSSHILTKTATEDCLGDATLAELKRGQYSDVIVSRSQANAVNNPQDTVLARLLGQPSRVNVCVIDVEQLITQSRKE